MKKGTKAILAGAMALTMGASLAAAVGCGYEPITVGEARKIVVGITEYKPMDYRRILEGAKKHLKQNGCVLFELGCTNGVSQSGIVAEIAEKQGFKLDFIEKDLSGTDRVIGFSLP